MEIKLFFFVSLLVSTLSLNVNEKQPENYIVGGNDAKPEQFPYLVSMRRTIERRHICGAAIVNARWILTAAHCITANEISAPDQFVNVVGTVSATSDDGDWYETLQYVIHPDFSPIFRNDVALIQTIKSINFGPMVMPVRLTPERIDVGNLTAVLAGFGQTRTQPRTDVKQFLIMRTMRSPDCRRHYLSFPFNAVRIFDSNICFSNPPGVGMCGGDSGGSIVIDQVSIGIASWVGVDCALGNPDVFARTSVYYSWIRNTTNIEREDD